MPDIYSTAYDGYMVSQDSSWATAREAAAADSYVGGSVSYANAVEATKNTAARRFTVTRTFLSFDCRTIYTVPSALSLVLRGITNDGADMYAVKGTQPTISVTTAHFDSIYGWDNDADNSSNVRKYSSEITTWATGLPGTNTIALNDNAKADMASNSYLQIVMIESRYDLTHTEPSDLTAISGMRYSEAFGTAFDPKLTYTAGVDSSPALMQINF